MIKVHTDLEHYNKSSRRNLIHLLKPFIKSMHYTSEELCKTYGSWVCEIEFTNSAEEADVVVLPMSWNYYVKENRTSHALRFIAESRERNPISPILTYVSGDFGVTPLLKDVFVIRASGYASRRLPLQIAQPIFINDPIKRIYKRDEIFLRPKNTKPCIGFCGHANGSYVSYVHEILRIGVRNIMYYFGITKDEPQKLISSSRLRSVAMHYLEQKNHIETNFIRRKKYRAGARTKEEIHETTIEYFENMKESDYVLCLRGGGNFSVRLYETLAMGRIPVFVNTDCILPFDSHVDWKKHLVWIEVSSLEHIAQIVEDFHSSLDSNSFRALQVKNRKLWEDYLSSGGFWNSLLSCALHGKY